MEERGGYHGNETSGVKGQMNILDQVLHADCKPVLEFTLVCVCACACVCARACVHACVCACVCIRAYVRACICACVCSTLAVLYDTNSPRLHTHDHDDHTHNFLDVTLYSVIILSGSGAYVAPDLIS